MFLRAKCIKQTYEWTPSDGDPDTTYLTFYPLEGIVDTEDDSIICTSDGTKNSRTFVKFNNPVANRIAILQFEYFIENTTENATGYDMLYFYIASKKWPSYVRGHCGFISAIGSTGTRQSNNTYYPRRTLTKGKWHTVKIFWDYITRRTRLCLDNNISFDTTTQQSSWTGEKINVMQLSYVWAKNCQGGRFKIRNIKIYKD